MRKGLFFHKNSCQGDVAGHSGIPSACIIIRVLMNFFPIFCEKFFHSSQKYPGQTAADLLGSAQSGKHG